MTEIFDYLFLGSKKDCFSHSFLITNSINCVISISIDHIPFPKEFNVLRLAFDDIPTLDLTPFFEQSVAFIEKNKDHGKILVHCTKGVSRSASVVLYYLMFITNKTLKESFTFLAKKRPIIHPNLGFFLQLLEYEKESGLSPEPSFHPWEYFKCSKEKYLREWSLDSY
jgi:hypothetical protein